MRDQRATIDGQSVVVVSKAWMNKTRLNYILKSLPFFTSLTFSIHNSRVRKNKEPAGEFDCSSWISYALNASCDSLNSSLQLWLGKNVDASL